MSDIQCQPVPDGGDGGGDAPVAETATDPRRERRLYGLESAEAFSSQRPIGPR